MTHPDEEGDTAAGAVPSFDAVFAGVLSRLCTHFDSVSVRQPLPSAQLETKLSPLPPLPRELWSFYGLCDGLQVADDVQGDIFDVSRVAQRYPVCDAPACARLIPIRGDGCGDYDCVVAGPGPCAGAVVFWDHEIYDGPAYLLGGTLAAYLSMWADKLIAEHTSDGRRRPETIAPRLSSWPWVGKPKMQHPWPFDQAWLRASDTAADQILRDPAQRAWLLRQDGQ
jgi:hypothetical protein